MNELKPCPFCGAIPTLYCDITGWDERPVYKAKENGYRPITYVLKAEHRAGCYIRMMDGTNFTGRTTASNYQWLMLGWNRRITDNE